MKDVGTTISELKRNVISMVEKKSSDSILIYFVRIITAYMIATWRLIYYYYIYLHMVG